MMPPSVVGLDGRSAPGPPPWDERREANGEPGYFREREPFAGGGFEGDFDASGPSRAASSRS